MLYLYEVVLWCMHGEFRVGSNWNCVLVLRALGLIATGNEAQGQVDEGTNGPIQVTSILEC